MSAYIDGPEWFLVGWFCCALTIRIGLAAGKWWERKNGETT